MKETFSEVLNDTIDYFLLGDIELLMDYKIKNNLSNDLATEFTTKENGDEIVKNGILIPMPKIVNQPIQLYSTFQKMNRNLTRKKITYPLRRVVIF